MGSTVETISLGCRLNAYETDRMASLASSARSGPTVVVNTCAVTNEAVRQSRQAIRRARKDHPDAEIIVSGCAATIDPESFGTMTEVDHLIGNADKLDPSAWAKEDANPHAETSQPLTSIAPTDARAHLEIQNGCDHQCTFCIIPAGRGTARSRPPEAIVEEAKHLVAAGAREIVLTGVDLTSYGPDLGATMSLADPLEALLSALPDPIRIRLSSVDGAEIDERLFALITEKERIMPHLHLSLQAGDTMILKRMKRRHNREEAVELCQRLRTARPEIALGADLIAGFPTETEDMFDHTLRLIEECSLAYVHVFPFSPREGTPAARMPQLPRELVKERAKRLRGAADAALGHHLQNQVGSENDALIEQQKGDTSFGKLPNFTDVMIRAPVAVASTHRIRITGVVDRRLVADLMPPSGQ